MGRNDDAVELGDVTLLREMDKAILVEVDGKQVSIPKSQLQEGTTIRERGGRGHPGHPPVAG